MNSIIKVYLICILSIGAILEIESATVDTDFGAYSISTKTYSDRTFASIDQIGKITFGQGTEKENGFFISDKGKLRFLPGSFFFTYEESGLSSSYQMIYPAIRDLSNSSEILVPVEEYGLALSSNKFEFRIHDGLYYLKRLESYKLSLAEFVAMQDKRTNFVEGNHISIALTAPLKSLKRQNLVRESEARAVYSYADLSPLPKSLEGSKKLVGIKEYQLPIAQSSSSKISRNTIPVYEEGEMRFEYEEQANQSNSSKPNIESGNSSAEPILNMGDLPKTDSIMLPPRLNYEVPKNIYRREIEEKLKKK